MQTVSVISLLAVCTTAKTKSSIISVVWTRAENEPRRGEVSHPGTAT